MLRLITIAALSVLATPAMSFDRCVPPYDMTECAPPKAAPPSTPAAIVDAASTIGDAKVIEFIPATDRNRRCILVTSEFGRPGALACWEKAR